MSKKKTGTELFTVFALSGAVMALRFYVLIQTWNYVLVPMGAPAITTFMQAWGISMVGAMIAAKLGGKAEERTFEESIQYLTVCTIQILITWLFAWMFFA